MTTHRLQCAKRSAVIAVLALACAGGVFTWWIAQLGPAPIGEGVTFSATAEPNRRAAAWYGAKMKSAASISASRTTGTLRYIRKNRNDIDALPSLV